MKKLIFFILSVILAANTVAQTCKCDVTITKEGGYDGSYLGYKAGQTICIKAGNYKYLYFKNIVGTASMPIRIINCGGQVTVGTESGQYGIQFWQSRYVKVTGTGSTDYKYGINLNQTPSGYSGLIVTGFSSDVEINNVEVSGTGFAGIMIKYDPTCDPATWRDNFAMYNIKVHDNYIHDTGGEGMYIGNSFWNSGVTVTCNGTSQVVYPHNIYGLRIYNNITERTGAEGIQFACSPEALVYNNVVSFAGVAPFATYQNSGIQGSGGNSGRLYNNTVRNVGGNGIIFIGHSGTNIVYNNLVTDVGGIGVFCDNRAGTPAGNHIIFTNNTIVNCGSDGFRLYNELDATTLTNNAVIQAGSGKLVLIASGVQVTQQANYYQATLSDAMASNVIDNTYKPMAGSPLVDQGMTNSYWGITYDLQGQPRPSGAGMDIGAYEYQSSSGGRLSAQAGTQNEADPNGVYSFPSPCTTDFSLKTSSSNSPISEVKIYNTKGDQVLYGTPRIPTHEVNLQTGDLPAGEYIFRVMTVDFKFSSGRFIKQ